MKFNRDTSHLYLPKEVRLLCTQCNLITLTQARRKVEEAVYLSIQGVGNPG